MHSEGEGWYSPTGVPGADNFTVSFFPNYPANLSGLLPPVSSGSIKPSKKTEVQKRSFARACRRAMTTGCSWYKGRVMTPADFPQHLRQKTAQKIEAISTPLTKPAPSPKQYNLEKRIRLFHWNSTGLTCSRLDELMHWLTIHDFDVAVLSETR